MPSAETNVTVLWHVECSNDSFSYPSVSDTTHVTEDESKALFNAIQSFMQSEIVDDSNSDPVFNAEAIYRECCVRRGIQQ